MNILTKRGFDEPPPIRTRVFVTFNGFGFATVRSYFIEDGWIGVEVECENRPEWHLKQNGDDHRFPLVFGAEIIRP
jgi:hypothetical protein